MKEDKDTNEKDWFKTAPADPVTVWTSVFAVIAVAVFVTLSAIYGKRGEKQPTEIQAPKSN